MLADQFQQAGGGTAGAPLTAFPLDQCRKTHAQQTGKILLSDAPGLAKLGNGVFIGPCTGLAGNDDRRPGFRQGCPVRQAVLNVQFRAFIQIPRYFFDGVSVGAIAVQFRQGTDKALILVTPPDKPCIRSPSFPGMVAETPDGCLNRLWEPFPPGVRWNPFWIREATISRILVAMSGEYNTMCCLANKK